MTVLSLLVVGAAAAISLTPSRSPLPGVATARSARCAVGSVRCAFDSGLSSKKVKPKTPKQKVKGPVPSVATQLVAEQTFWEGPPSITETFIPGLSLFTVIGVIPFSASLARQAWTRYKITNKRLEVKSGFQGNDVVQITWREVTDAKWLRRYGGSCGDLVLTLRDGAKVEVRSLPDFDRNLNFMMSQFSTGVAEDSGYPDGPGRAFLDKVASGELPAATLPEASEATPAAEPAA